jgi:RyR domain
MTPTEIAKVCHETNRAYCQILGDDSQATWEEAPEWHRTSVINGVKFHLANPNSTPSHSHGEWLKEKTATGWKYGSVKNSGKKEHPCFMPFDELPTEHKAKDALFVAVVNALRAYA